MANSITIFSNGIADFIRSFKIEKGKTQKIKLSVKKDHVGDLLASFNLYGPNLKLIAPPSFPTNAEGVLALETENVFQELGNKLSGAAVEVLLSNDQKYKGILVGTDIQTDQQGRIQQYLVVSTESGLRKFNLSLAEDSPNCVQTINFEDADIRKEVERALNRNLQNIKPNSTVVELAVANEGAKDAEAYVQYSVPAAAWKISYRLNSSKEQTEFKGLAVVDNNTEENWDDVLVSVVTGEPITFSTDIADAKVPRRSHVNIVKDSAASPVELESYGGGFEGASPARSMKAMRSASFGSEAVMACALADDDRGGSAITSQAETKEQGDFCIYTTKTPVSIAAHTSTVIPVFDAVLDEAKTVLHYNQKNNAKRAYRSIEFKNETGHALERGVCTVNLEGLYSGSCIVPAMKENERQLLPYALETGVKINSKSKQSEFKLKRLIASGGGFTLEACSKVTTDYSIENIKKEAFKFCLEHPAQIQDKDGIVAKIKKGAGEWAALDGTPVSQDRRYEFDLQEKASVAVQVVETIINEQSLVLTGSSRYDWFYNSYIANNGPLTKVKGADNLIKACDKVTQITLQITENEEETRKLSDKQNRLIRMIEAGQGTQVADWQKELGTLETKITDLTEAVPNLKKKKEEAVGKVIKVLEEISSQEFSVSL